MDNKVRVLTNIYFILVFILVVLILLTPHLVNEVFFTSFDDSIAETTTLAILIIIGFIIRNLYYRETKRHQRDINELVGHVGNINIQVQEIKSFFSDIKKYPESKSDLRYIFNILADRVLAIANVEWILFRIIDISNAATLSEYMQRRDGVKIKKFTVSNKDLCQNRLNNGYGIIKTNQENFNIRAFCVLPKNNLNENQKIFIGRITSDLEMLYLIFSSQYYENTRAKNNSKNVKIR